jgi:hypothetical protein
VIVIVFITSTRFGIDHAISPMSRFSLLWDGAGQRQAAGFTADLDVTCARQELEHVVHQFFDVLIGGRTVGLPAVHGDRGHEHQSESRCG